MSSTSPSDIAYRVLQLEQRLESYQRLHEEELEEIRRALMQLKEEVLVIIAQREAALHEGDETKPE